MSREIVLEHVGAYLMTVKGNQTGLQACVCEQVPDPGFPLLR